MPITHDASFIDSLPANVAVQFLERVEKSPEREAFRYPVGESWESLTWRQAGEEVSRLAAGLLSLGLQPEQRVGIASGTRYEWILADLAIMCAAGATTTVYPSTNEEDTAYILSPSPAAPTATGSSTSTASPPSATPTSPSTRTSSRRRPRRSPATSSPR